MKTLFLIDGAYGDAKKSLCEILRDENIYSWTLIKKLSTKDVTPLPQDMEYIDESTALSYFNQYNNATPLERYNTCRFFCYKYPRIDGYSNEEINCIDTQSIDAICKQGYDYGFLIVRSHRCMADLIKRYEENGQLNVVPVFIYSDDHYISEKDEFTKKKSKKLFDDFINDSAGRARINFEDILIYKTELDGTHPKDILKLQIIHLIERISTKNQDLFVVTANERYFLPEIIRVHYKDKLQKELGADVVGYRKRFFLIMPFNSMYDSYYEKIKRTLEEHGCSCVRADEEVFSGLCSDAKPDVSYWLKMYMCKHAIAFFDSNKKNNLVINANVVYEMGIMKQQGKDICLLVPEGARLNRRDAEFFDIRNEWKYEYQKDSLHSVGMCIEKFINRVV